MGHISVLKFIYLLSFFFLSQKAKRSYQKDVEAFKETRDTNAQALDVGVDGDESKS